MNWKPAPIIKVYEALGTIADGRIHIDGNTAKVYSSSGNKFYEVTYDPAKHAIGANDNASYWVGYLGYPSIAYVLATGKVPYNKQLATYLKGFAWKDLNHQFGNNFAKTQSHIDAEISRAYQIDISSFHAQLEELRTAVNQLQLAKLPGQKRPPSGY